MAPTPVAVDAIEAAAEGRRSCFPAGRLRTSVSSRGGMPGAILESARAAFCAMAVAPAQAGALDAFMVRVEERILEDSLLNRAQRSGF